MDKNEILSQLRQAKLTHIQWRSYALALLSGIPVKEKNVPVMHTDCKFGQWYYGPGQKLSYLGSYVFIETPHEMLHRVYMKMFKLLFGEDDGSRYRKLFESKAKIKKKKQEEAELLMQKFLSLSGSMLEAIDLLEQEVMDLSEEELSNH